MSVPYYLLSKRTQLPEGHDDTLDPPEPPTDPARRTVSLLDWLRVDTSKGPAGPPDAPLAPPAVDPARRTVPAFDWPRGLPGRIANRSVREFLPLQLITLDPDIALWQTVPVSIWPFEGPPEEGSWPRGWFGIDNTATPYVCTVAGEPGTWAPLGFAGGAGWPAVNGAGAGNLNAATADDDTVGYSLVNNGSGPITIAQDGSGTLRIGSENDQGVVISADAGPIQMEGEQFISSCAQFEVDTTSSPTGISLSVSDSGNIVLVGVPTADPAIAGAVWNDSGILHISAG